MCTHLSQGLSCSPADRVVTGGGVLRTGSGVAVNDVRLSISDSDSLKKQTVYATTLMCNCITCVCSQHVNVCTRTNRVPVLWFHSCYSALLLLPLRGCAWSRLCPSGASWICKLVGGHCTGELCRRDEVPGWEELSLRCVGSGGFLLAPNCSGLQTV